MEFTAKHNKTLQLFRTCSPAEISHLVATEIPQNRLPLTYLNNLSEEDKIVCLRATMICWVISETTMVPREMQLRVVLADVPKCGPSFFENITFLGKPVMSESS
jgi:hypothetical protein